MIHCTNGIEAFRHMFENDVHQIPFLMVVFELLVRHHVEVDAKVFQIVDNFSTR